MKRREFLKSATASVAALVSSVGCAPERESKMSREPTGQAPLPRRPYGRNGISLSIIGLGGIVVSRIEQPRADRIVAEYVERGGNYFDVAPTYGDAELKLGPALQPYRKQAFLACKTTQRRREQAEAEFKESLKRLRTDYFDLYQLHGITDVEKDVDVAFASGGVMEWLIEARKAGQVRHLGFSAHSVEAAEAALDRYPFDSILFPVNFACWFKTDFGPQILELAKQKHASVLALKAMARQVWPENAPDRQDYAKCWYQPLTDPHEAELGLRFTLSRQVTAAVPPGEEKLFRLALDCAERYQPPGENDLQQLESLAAGLNPIFPAVT